MSTPIPHLGMHPDAMTRLQNFGLQKEGLALFRAMGSGDPAIKPTDQEIAGMRWALREVGMHHQGASSRAGQIIAAILGIPFPLRADTLGGAVASAIKEDIGYTKESFLLGAVKELRRRGYRTDEDAHRYAVDLYQRMIDRGDIGEADLLAGDPAKFVSEDVASWSA